MAESLRETPTSPGDAWRPPAEQEQTDGLRLHGYRDFVRVAAGTGSRVYRAWQQALDRPVAVKVLHLDDPEAIARFEREIDITVQLGRRHPNIVTVLDIGSTADGRPCIVMEYCDGGSLHDRLRAHGPLPPDEVLEAGIVVADALWFAHGQGVLHRDVKPQNILVLPTSYVLADFGIARRADATQHTSSVDWFTFQHASPQVIDGETPNEQDDIWSVGSTLFTLLDGRSPHAGNLPEDNKPLAYMRRVRTAAARPLNRGDVPAGLGEIIARCLRPERENRFATAADLRDALLAVKAQMRSWAPQQGQGGQPQARARVAPAEASRQAQPPKSSTTDSTGRALESLTMQRPAAPMTPAELANLVASAASAAYPVMNKEEPPPPPVEEPPRRLRGRRLAIAAAAALLAGAVAGTVATMAVKQSKQDNQSAQQQPPQQQQPQQQPSSVPQPSGSAEANMNDPAIAPELTTVQVTGSSVLLKWRDPTRGKAEFVVVRVEGGKGEAVVAVDAGRTETTLEAVQGSNGPVCFLLISVMQDRRGFSPTKCSGTAIQ